MKLGMITTQNTQALYDYAAKNPGNAAGLTATAKALGFTVTEFAQVSNVTPQQGVINLLKQGATRDQLLNIYPDMVQFFPDIKTEATLYLYTRPNDWAGVVRIVRAVVSDFPSAAMALGVSPQQAAINLTGYGVSKDYILSLYPDAAPYFPSAPVVTQTVTQTVTIQKTVREKITDYWNANNRDWWKTLNYAKSLGASYGDLAMAFSTTPDALTKNLLSVGVTGADLKSLYPESASFIPVATNSTTTSNSTATTSTNTPITTSAAPYAGTSYGQGGPVYTGESADVWNALPSTAASLTTGDSVVYDTFGPAPVDGKKGLLYIGLGALAFFALRKKKATT